MLELEDLIHQIKNLVLLLAELQNIIDFGNIVFYDANQEGTATHVPY